MSTFSSKVNNTLLTETDLQLLTANIASSATYEVTGGMRVTQSSATPDFKFAFTCAPSCTQYYMTATAVPDSGATASVIGTSEGVGYSLQMPSGENLVTFNGFVTTSSSILQTSISFAWAQNTTASGNATILQAASFLIYRRVN